ncbi:MAG: di-trans,poly-cis-decaprenylcistransferase [Thermomicrobiales bacterium]|nr:di-trans,poly-cis-decaprenylcistransferase [Thermomicrobiales bacterium]
MPSPGHSSVSGELPVHVAIIMDGNGRWAAQQGLPRIAGHERGTENIRRVTNAAAEAGIDYLTLWAFSTENWSRPLEEVAGIMRLLGEALDRETMELHRQGAQLRHIGSLEGLAPDLRKSVEDAIELTKHNTRLKLTLAFDYGGRQEVVRAMQEIVRAGIPADEITEETIARHLYTCDMPDPDLVIRTSGEHRMSNFLIWQAAYAELHFSPVYWPDFGPEHLQLALDDYASRERRFGNISAEAAALTSARGSR